MDELNINWDEIPASDEYSLEEILLQFRSEEQVMEVDRPEVKVEKTETKAEVQTGPEAEVPTGAEVEEKSEEKVEASVWEKFRTRAAEKPAPRTEEKAGIKAEPKADTGIWEKFRTKVAEKPAARTEQKAEPKEKPRKKKPEKKAEKESSRHLSAPKVRESFPPENSAELPDPEEVLSLFKTFVEEAPPSDHTEVSPVQSEEKPLLAEDSPDFRDILREFMMGDQHPLYRETTGMAYREPEAAEPEEEEEEKELVLPEVRPRKTYPVEEFFPAENESPEEPESEPSLPEPEPESPEEPEEPEESGDFDEAEQPQEPEASEGEVTVESDEEDSSEEDDLRYLGDFPPFGQWILNELTGYWIKLNGIGNRESTHTMEDDKEDPGPEVNVAVASRYYGSQVTMLRMRFQIGLALLAVLAWITLGFPVSGMLKTVKTASMMCLGLQLVIMLLCLDIITNALINLTRGKFGADALALLACIASCWALAPPAVSISIMRLPTLT